MLRQITPVLFATALLLAPAAGFAFDRASAAAGEGHMSADPDGGRMSADADGGRMTADADPGIVSATADGSRVAANDPLAALDPIPPKPIKKKLHRGWPKKIGAAAKKNVAPTSAPTAARDTPTKTN
jgi:hypothetical protein